MADVSSPLATLGLAGDLDEADVLRDIEGAFGVTFGDAPAAWRSVGDIELDLLCLFPTQDMPGRCATMMAFHQIRTALGLRQAGPHAIVGDIEGVSAGSLTKLGRELGLRIPSLEASWRGTLGLVLLCLGSPALAIVGIATTCWWPLAGCLVAGAALVAMDRGRLGNQTLGDLSREIALLNYVIFVTRGADRRPQTVRRVLYALACSQTGADPRRVTPETLLYGW